MRGSRTAIVLALQAAEKLHAEGPGVMYGLQPVHKPSKIIWPLGPGVRFLFRFCRNRSFSAVCLALALVFCTGRPAAGQAKEYFLYSGTYTGFQYVLHGNPAGQSHSEGIYVSRFRPATGDLTEAKAERIRSLLLKSLARKGT